MRFLLVSLFPRLGLASLRKVKRLPLSDCIQERLLCLLCLARATGTPASQTTHVASVEEHQDPGGEGDGIALHDGCLISTISVPPTTRAVTSSNTLFFSEQDEIGGAFRRRTVGEAVWTLQCEGTHGQLYQYIALSLSLSASPCTRPPLCDLSVILDNCADSREYETNLPSRRRRRHRSPPPVMPPFATAGEWCMDAESPHRLATKAHLICWWPWILANRRLRSGLVSVSRRCE